MVNAPSVTFVVAVNDDTILARNFELSPCLQEVSGHQVILQRNFASAAEAYNDAIAKSSNELMIFVHQDVYFPRTWLSELQRALDLLHMRDPAWGVLGCYGANAKGKFFGYLYASAEGLHGEPFAEPVPVQTLDEIVLIVRKSSGLKFDGDLPNFHLYGTDICLSAATKGMTCYAISAPCIHNTRQNVVLPPEFYESCAHVQHVWREHLPIQTTCIRLTRYNSHVYWRRLKETYIRYKRGGTTSSTRRENALSLLHEFETLS
jgi:hypothetical protein